ncbi:MAG: LysR substrate-binding domain-containing protein [Coriobacteriia bacterium]
MNTEQFEYFVVLYNTRSYSAAAKRIPMTPQGLMKAVKHIECDLGVRLFSQGDGGLLTPTSYADKLYEYLQIWGKDWIALKEAFDRIRAQETNEIRLVASMGILGLLGPEFFDQFKESHPEISVSYEERDDVGTDEELLHESRDLAITLYPFDQRFVTTELFACPIAFWVNKDDPLSAKGRLPVDELEGKKLAWPSKGYKINSTLKEFCERRNVSLGDIYESEQMFVIFDFVQSGKGLGFTLPQIARLPVFSDNRDVVCVLSEDIVLRCGISYLRSHVLTPSERIFLSYCVRFTSGSRRLLNANDGSEAPH